jgi:2-polyprenyl-6-methoxyphenol hydroxylase-like FAD-dependent oxidoreductase
METVIVGAGPTGLYSAIALARRGHGVRVIDRDPGPDSDGTWTRKGVMQFHHPHAVRQQICDALLAEMPEVWDLLLAAGAEPILLPDQPGRVVGMRCRRLTFERVLRSAAEAEPGVALSTGHVDEIRHEAGRVAGVRVGGRLVDADLVLDASGRAGRLSRDLRAPAEESDCGISYVSRQYELLPGAQNGPMNAPVGMVITFPGYLAIVFLHDNGVFSTLIARGSTDRQLAELRHPEAYEAATRAVPFLAEWTEPDRARPITPVLPGGRLYNSYQGQLNGAGRVPVDGLIFVGDAVCTTNPTAGRGIATSLLQARRLLELLDHDAGDLTACSLGFDRWCLENIKPWFDDHVYWDDEQIKRWSGQDIDLSRRLPSDLITAATEADPSLFRVVGPYLGMNALPDTLAAAEPRARELYASGWRPSVPEGPTRDELADIVTAATAGERALS